MPRAVVREIWRNTTLLYRNHRFCPIYTNRNRTALPLFCTNSWECILRMHLPNSRHSINDWNYLRNCVLRQRFLSGKVSRFANSMADLEYNTGEQGNKYQCRRETYQTLIPISATPNYPGGTRTHNHRGQNNAQKTFCSVSVGGPFTVPTIGKVQL